VYFAATELGGSGAESAIFEIFQHHNERPGKTAMRELPEVLRVLGAIWLDEQAVYTA
jgi:hypothetical protein